MVERRKTIFDKVMFSIKKSNFIHVSGIKTQISGWYSIEKVTTFFIIKNCIKESSLIVMYRSQILGLIFGKCFL